MDPRPARPRVLVVDDQPRGRLEVVSALSARFDVSPLLEGEEPLRVARARRPELVLLALGRTPDEYLRVCRTLKTDVRPIDRVAVYTRGRPTRSVEQVCDVWRSDGYLAGEFQRDLLLDFVEAVLRGERPVRLPPGDDAGPISRLAARLRRVTGR